MNEKEARRILNVLPNATLKECKKSMIKQQKAFHPNFAKNDDQLDVFTRKSQEVNDAYAFLQVVLTKKQRPKTPINYTKDEIIDTATTYAEQKLKDIAKEARKKYNKEWKEKNKEKLKELTKEYKEKNKAKLKELTEEYKKKNKEKLKAYQKDLRKKLKQHKRDSKLKEKKDWLSE